MKQPGQFMFIGRTNPDMEGGVRGMIGTLEKSGFDTSRIDFKKVKIEGAFGSFRFVQMNLDGELKGWFFPLTAVNAIKQMEFPDNLDWVWMDEFIPEKYTKLAGIDDEAIAIQNIMITIDHDAFHTREERGLRKLRFIGTFNPRTWDNPIIQGFRLQPRGFGITKIQRDIVLEMVEVPKEMYRKESAEDWLNNNSARESLTWLDDMNLVEPLPTGAKPLYSLRLDDTFTLYAQGYRFWWVKRKKDLEYKWTLKDFPNEDETFLPKAMKQAFRRYIDRGLVRFPDVNTKFDFINQYNLYS